MDVGVTILEHDAFMRCCYCGTRMIQRLRADEIATVGQGARPRRYCETCVGLTEWEFLGWKGLPPGALPETAEEHSTHRILMIDDDDLTIAVLRKVLEEDECIFEFVHDGREALEKLKEQHYSLVICDIHMPNLDGKELFRILENQGVEARKAILFLTGDTGDATREFLEETGCPYMYKPIQVLQFASAVREILESNYPASA